MSGPEQVDPGLVEQEETVDEPTRDLEAWQRWREDQASLGSPTGAPGLKGWFAAAVRRALRPVIKQLAKRQIGFNLSVIDHLEAAERARFDLLRDLREIRRDLLRDVQNNHRRIAHLEAFKREGYADVMRHSDALYAVVDQKLDRYRRQSRRLWGDLGGLLARVEGVEPARAAEILEQEWQSGSRPALGDRTEATGRADSDDLERVLEHLPPRGRIVDLGCGNGAALKWLTRKGYDAQGVDWDETMTRECRQKGLNASQGNVLDFLQGCPPASLAGVISRRVVERLEPEQIDRLVRLAWRALEPGGSLILETPNPLSLVVAASRFWRDLEHRRPIHPESLELLLGRSGFQSIERLELSPFAPEERLPELDLEELPAEQRALAERLNRIRDDIDELLYGYQLYAVIGKKPL